MRSATVFTQPGCGPCRQAERGRILDEMAKQKQASSSAGKTFVNSFGEAATREITTPTCERARRRMNRDVLRNMGY